MKRWCLWLCVCVGIWGCLGGSRPAPLVRQYVLEYPAPAPVRPAPVTALLKVDRFTSARSYAGPEMLSRQEPYGLAPYHEQRWRVSPADLVTDLLRRDLRSAGLFQAVLGFRDREETRYVLQGGVEEFLERAGPQGRLASLTVTLALIDQSRRGVTQRLLFQKTYRAEAPCTQAGAAGLAEAMSRAMAQCSTQVLTDIAAALQAQGEQR